MQSLSPRIHDLGITIRPRFYGETAGGAADVVSGGHESEFCPFLLRKLWKVALEGIVVGAVSSPQPFKLRRDFADVAAVAELHRHAI